MADRLERREQGPISAVLFLLPAPPVLRCSVPRLFLYMHPMERCPNVSLDVDSYRHSLWRYDRSNRQNETDPVEMAMPPMLSKRFPGPAHNRPHHFPSYGSSRGICGYYSAHRVVRMPAGLHHVRASPVGIRQENFLNRMKRYLLSSKTLKDSLHTLSASILIITEK